MANSDPVPTPELQPTNEPALGPLSKLRRALTRAWQAVCDVSTVLHPCRFSVFVVIAGAALLFATSQGRELAENLPDLPLWFAGVAFQLCVFLWAFESWYWSRLMLDATFGLDRTRNLQGERYAPRIAWLIRHAPRIIALLAFAVAGAALALAAAWLQLAAVAVIGVLFYCFLVARLSITQALHDVLGTVSRKVLDTPGRSVARLRSLPPLSKWILASSVLLAAACTLLVARDPVSFGWALGAAAVPFIGFALIVPVGSLLVYWFTVADAPQRLTGTRRFPVVTLLLVWAVVVGRFVDNHAVRTLPSAAAAPASGPEARPELATTVERWHEEASKAAGIDKPPLIIVATAGGGLRAAYWTATVLGALQDADPKFRSYVFAISGVSGGSLGAAVFATLLADGTAGISAAACAGRKATECAGQAVLAQDFLAPTAASMMFTDLMQRFIPAVVFPQDRAAALELSWERAWGPAGLPADTWVGRTFTGLWRQDEPYIPVLLLNGTHVESGKRIVTGNLRIRGDAYPDTYDFFDLVPRPIRISTAALNSARFAYVSPAGTMEANDHDRGHLVDGGYFENFGAVTARETLRAVMAALAAKGKSAEPFLIQISNDPTLSPDDLDIDRVRGPDFRPPSVLADEVLSPLRTYINTRDAHGVLALKEYLREVPAGRRAHFRLCKVAGERDPALGWLLAQASRDFMQRTVRDDACGNRAELVKVLSAIRSPAAR